MQRTGGCRKTQTELFRESEAMIFKSGAVVVSTLPVLPGPFVVHARRVKQRTNERPSPPSPEILL